MQYQNCFAAIFISRPNRFIAHCLLNNQEIIAHVKNTGRCKELLISGCIVYLEKSDNLARKTLYSLIAVKKGERIINMDSQAPNQVFYEGLCSGNIKLQGLGNITFIKRESVFEDSRFDFYLEAEKTDKNGQVFKQKAFAEIKGVTLEDNGVVLFPDAPTERGVKHVLGLCNAVKQGYMSYIVFIVQMQDVCYFTPNIVTHKRFADVLQQAQNQGVALEAFDCITAPDKLIVNNKVAIKLNNEP